MKVITKCKANTITSGIIDNCTIIIESGKIAAVGAGLPVPPGAQVIDAEGCYVTPGLIDCHSHIGALALYRTNPGVTDTNEYSDPATPHVRALDSINPADDAIHRTRNAGFTACCILPGSANVAGGTGVSVKLRGATADEMIIPDTEQMKFALGENPKRFYGLKGAAPVTRMGSAGILRKLLFDAREYSEGWLEFEKGRGAKPARDFKLEALVRAVRGEMRCRIHCHRADDIATAIRIAKEFHLDYILEHVTEGYKITDTLAQEQATCVLGPLLLMPAKMEVWELRHDTPALLEKAGVRICLSADDSETQWLPMQVGLMMRNGLSEKTAFESVTINPARVLGLEARMGALEPGKDADIAVFDGFPFSNMTKCLYTLIDGEVFKH